MMKFQTTIAASLATILVLPAVAVSGDDIGTLEDALGNTARALEILTGIQSKAEESQGSLPGLVVAVTEPPILDARLRDDRLNVLRNEVSLLRTELDLIESPPPTAGADPTARIDVPKPPLLTGNTGDSLPSVHTGLDAKTMQALRSMTDPDTARGKPRTASGARKDPRPEQRVESEGYSADPLGQARACYRAKRYEQGADLLAGPSNDPDRLYWRARCYEKLGRLDEAATDLRKVIEVVDDEFERKRAQTDLEFVEWKQEFMGKIGKRTGEKQG